MTTAVTDAELVKSSQRSDAEAFGVLVDRYRDMVYGLGYHLTGRFEDARDLAQEAFVQAFLRLSQLREPEHFSAWLRQITLNVYRMSLRRKEVTTVSLDEGLHASSEYQLTQVEVVVHEALSRLREPERLALTLHYINGYSQAEIGQFLGIRAETVKTRLARARQHLKEEMMAMVEDEFEKKKLPDTFTEQTIAEAIRRGNTALNDDDYETALTAFGQAVALRPDSAEAHAGLGNAWELRAYHVADPEATVKARAEFEEALQHDPRNEDALIGSAYLEPDNRRREAYVRALEILPESAELRYRLAWETHAAGEMQRAIEMLEEMSREDIPSVVLVRVHNNLGTLYRDSLGDAPRGRKYLRLAAETAENSSTRALSFFHWRVYAWTALWDRQWSEALAAASHVIDVAPTDFERRNMHIVQAAALANLSQPDEGIEHLRKAAKPGPEPPQSGRMPWPYHTPQDADPLEFVRQHREDFFSSIADDQRVKEILRQAD